MLHSGTREGERLHTRFVDLDVPTKAAVVRLDPIADPDEFNVLLHLEERAAAGGERRELSADAANSTDPGERAVGMRIENLRVARLGLWSWGGLR